MKSYQIYLIRHGITEGNIKGQYIGKTDSPICEQGFDELKRQRNEFHYPKVEACYCSSLTRCIQTAGVLYPDAETIIVGGLSERDFGDFEGKIIDELKLTPEYRGWIACGGGDAPTNGECAEEFMDRICTAFERIVDELLRNGTTSVAIITHSGTIMGIMAQFALPKQYFYNWACANGRGFAIRITPQLWMRDKICEFIDEIPDDYVEHEEDETFAEHRRMLEEFE
jgi:alpha-ribazole phosphatase